MPDDGALLAAPAPAYNRWPVLATCMLVEAFSGMMYAFGLYSAALKKNFDLSQGELMALGFVNNLCAGGRAFDVPLCIACVMVGGAYGALQALSPTIASEVFGARLLTKLCKPHTHRLEPPASRPRAALSPAQRARPIATSRRADPFVTLWSALGSLTIATLLASSIYAAANRAHNQPADATCIGPDCFRDSYRVCVGLSLGALLPALLLAHRTRGRYRALLHTDTV